MGTWNVTPRTWVAGEVPTATHFNDNVRDFGRAFSDAWTSYTPTLTCSTTNPTASITQTGYYMRAGKLVIAKFKVTLGASGGATPYGTGTYRIALPVNANTTIGDVEVGAVVGYDNSAAAYAPLNAIAASAYVTLGYAATHNGTFTAVGNAAPWTWAQSDFIRGTIVYETA